jgi:hypothetical protein
MTLLHKTTTLLAVGISAVLSFYEAPASAFTLNQNNNRFDLQNSFFGNTAGLSNFNITLIGDGRAFGTFTDDPFGLQKGVVLSTGRVIDIAGLNTIDGGFNPSDNDLSTDFAPFDSPLGDSITMQIDFDADATKDALYFQYVFGSEELVEYAGLFNDSFSLELNGENLAQLRNGAAVTIDNLAATPYGPYSNDFIYNPVGTGPASNQTKLDGYTQPFTFEGPLQKNAKNTLVINVQDARDGLFDSLVFLKARTFGTERPPDIIPGGGNPGGGNGNTTIPEPASGVGILAFGALSTGLILKKHRNNRNRKSWL